jgi:hypothetical protein
MDDEPPGAQAPEPAADPIADEDSLYVAVVSEYQGLRRAGAGIIAAAAISAAHLTFAEKAGQA